MYALHPCSEDTARRAAVAFAGSAAPVQRWELEAATPTTRPDDDPWRHAAMVTSDPTPDLTIRTHPLVES